MSERVSEAIEARERRSRGEPEPRKPRAKKEPEPIEEEGPFSFHEDGDGAEG
jgi:hypothetical protein